MYSADKSVIFLSSAAIRVLSYVFLRWVRQSYVIDEQVLTDDRYLAM